MKKNLLFITAMLLLTFNVLAEPDTGITTLTYNYEEGAYEINNWEELLWVSQNDEHWDKDFIQTADIVFPGEIDTWYDEKGWSPIGRFLGRDEVPKAFTGRYDGNSKTIKNLIIDRVDETVGLFGFIAGGAQISNIQLIDAEIYGSEGVGGIAGLVGVDQGDPGKVESLISQCSVVGVISGTSAVGGIAGALLEGEIKESYNEAEISGGLFVGGLVGLILGGTVENLYNCGKVTGIDAIGGLVGAGGELFGENYSVSITNSYSAGTIEVIDELDKEQPPPREPVNSRILNYDFGDRFSKDEKPPSVGGFIGLADEGEDIENCFYDIELLDNVLSILEDDPLGVVSKTTQDMMNPETYSSWGGDIIEDPNVEKGYPFFAWQQPNDKGSKEPVWLIGTGTGDPVAVPLSDAALYLLFFLFAGTIIFVSRITIFRF
jgi:hypothetical protein